MTKKILLLLILPLVFISSAYAQRDVDNIPNFDKQRWHWGYYLGANSYDFKISPNSKGMTKGGALGINTETHVGFTVGLIGDIRLNDYFNLRFEPGLDITGRKLTYEKDIIDQYPGFTSNERTIKSTYINLPLLIKFGGRRSHNIRPYLIGGANLSYNQSSNKGGTGNDESTDSFRMTSLNYSWQAGAGIDWYLPFVKFSTEIRGSFGINNEMIDDPGTTPWTDPIDNLQTRALFFVVKFE